MCEICTGSRASRPMRMASANAAIASIEKYAIPATPENYALWYEYHGGYSESLRATIDPHSPEKYRTNGVVSNMPQFQEAFHCKAGSPMVNQNRCQVW